MYQLAFVGWVALTHGMQKQGYPEEPHETEQQKM